MTTTARTATNTSSPTRSIATSCLCLALTGPLLDGGIGGSDGGAIAGPAFLHRVRDVRPLPFGGRRLRLLGMRPRRRCSPRHDDLHKRTGVAPGPSTLINRLAVPAWAGPRSEAGSGREGPRLRQDRRAA